MILFLSLLIIISFTSLTCRESRTAEEHNLLGQGRSVLFLVHSKAEYKIMS